MAHQSLKPEANKALERDWREAADDGTRSITSNASVNLLTSSPALSRHRLKAGVGPQNMQTNDTRSELRTELMQWQGRRFTVLASVLLVVPAVLGWVVANPNAFSWAVGAVFPLLLLLCGCHLTWLFSVFTVMIGTYLELHCNSDWEKRSRVIREIFRIPSVNASLSLLYLVLGAVSIVIPLITCKSRPSLPAICVFASVAALYLAALLNMALRSYPRRRMLERWQRVENTLTSKAQQSLEGDSENRAEDGTVPGAPQG